VVKLHLPEPAIHPLQTEEEPGNKTHDNDYIVELGIIKFAEMNSTLKRLLEYRMELVQ
jgi:hypothetical protein